VPEQKKIEEVELIRCRMNIGGKIHVPIKVRREQGLEDEDYFYMRSDVNRGIIILYTQRYFKLVPVGATEENKEEANSEGMSVNNDEEEEIQED
jgi:bifunctional DNA-binding transcriptional regulator/antitoxin component of YhaV-PrlF toxin-antitoxin module